MKNDRVLLVRLVRKKDFNGLFVECINYLGVFEGK